jgi:hypothetical protein
MLGNGAALLNHGLRQHLCGPKRCTVVRERVARRRNPQQWQRLCGAHGTAVQRWRCRCKFASYEARRAAQAPAFGEQPPM